MSRRIHQEKMLDHADLFDELVHDHLEFSHELVQDDLPSFYMLELQEHLQSTLR